MVENISKEEVLDRIRFENPWWIDGKIDQEIADMPGRLYLDLFKPLVYEREVRRAVVLMGPRRVGKTVMLYHTVHDLLKQGVDPKKIIFITVENPIYNNIRLEKLFNWAREASGLEEEEEWFVIFDEIQYCKDWEVQLKSLVDSYRKDKFVVSGSAAAALKYASTESGAGRFTDFKLPPLTFNEYLHLKNLAHLIKPTTLKWEDSHIEYFTSTHMVEFNRQFIEYINYGGYPEVIFSQKIRENPGRFLRQDIVDKVLLRDLPSLYGIKDTRELNSLFTTIAYNTGGEFSLEDLSKKSQVAKHTLKIYIEYLEAAFLIKKVRRVDGSGKKFRRDNRFKLYLTNPSLRSALFSPAAASDDKIGQIVETAIFAQWAHHDWFVPWYARWKNGEVDIVALNEKNLKPKWAVEVKYTDRYVNNPAGLKTLVRFCRQNNLDNAIVTTLSKVGEANYQGIDIRFLPSASYAYTIGKRTFRQRMT